MVLIVIYNFIMSSLVYDVLSRTRMKFNVELLFRVVIKVGFGDYKDEGLGFIAIKRVNSCKTTKAQTANAQS